MSNIFKKAYQFIFHAKVAVSDFLVKLFGPQAAVELGHGALTVLKSTKLGAEVLKYVEEFAGNQYAAMTSDVKRLQVFSRAHDFAAKHGIEISDSLLNLVIELAVSKVKGYFDSIAPHDPAQTPAISLPVQASVAPAAGANVPKSSTPSPS